MAKRLDTLRKQIEALGTKWQGLLDLDHMTINHNFSEIRSENYATTATSWHYRSAEMEWFLPNLLDLPDEEVEATVVHEFCHVLNGPIRGDLGGGRQTSRRYELATENTARALLKVLRSRT